MTKYIVEEAGSEYCHCSPSYLIIDTSKGKEFDEWVKKICGVYDKEDVNIICNLLNKHL